MTVDWEKSNSRDGADGRAGGCLTPLPFSVASIGEEGKMAAAGTARRRNQRLSSPPQSTEVILARQQLVIAPSSATMVAATMALQLTTKNRRQNAAPISKLLTASRRGTLQGRGTACCLPLVDAAACEDVWWCMVRKTACWLWLGDVDCKE